MSTSRSNRSSRTRLGLEFLEGRVVPAVVVTQLDLDGDGATDDLSIVGDLNKNAVTINDNGTGTLTVSIDANGDGDTTDFGDLNNVGFSFTNNSVAVVVNLRGGNDTVTYNMANVVGGSRSLNVALGQGNDTFNLNAGNLNTAARLDLGVTGALGNDKTNITVGTVQASSVAIREDLGLGNDMATVKFGLIDTHAAADVDVDLGDGLNTFAIDLDGVGKFTQADVAVNVIGGVDTDNVAVNLHDDVGGGLERSSLLINADLGAGNDTFTTGIDYAGQNFRVDDHSLVSISARGGLGNDNMTVQGIGNSGTIHVDPDALLDISLRGGAGNDNVAVNLGKTDALFLEGGIRVRMDGGAGNDTENCLLANTSNTTVGNYDVIVLGGAGDDSMVFALDTNGGTPKFDPLGKVILDGGLGTDTLTNSNKSVSTASFFETII